MQIHSKVKGIDNSTTARRKERKYNFDLQRWESEN